MGTFVLGFVSAIVLYRQVSSIRQRLLAEDKRVRRHGWNGPVNVLCWRWLHLWHGENPTRLYPNKRSRFRQDAGGTSFWCGTWKLWIADVVTLH